MSAISRPVTMDEKGCRVCKKFNAKHGCWINEDEFGEDCIYFDRNIDIKRVMDFEE